MTDTPPPTGLAGRIAEALMSWAETNNSPAYASFRRPDTVTQNAHSRATAVMAVVEPEIDRARSAGMREAAAMLRRHCPDHGTESTCFMACHCAGAAEIQRDANNLDAARDTTS